MKTKLVEGRYISQKKSRNCDTLVAKESAAAAELH